MTLHVCYETYEVGIVNSELIRITLHGKLIVKKAETELPQER